MKKFSLAIIINIILIIIYKLSLYYFYPFEKYFSIFDIKIYYYSITMFTAISIILYNIREEIDKIPIWKIFIISISIIIGARLYHVLLSFNYYQYHLDEIINIRNGGIGIFGALIFAIITAYYLLSKKEFYKIINKVVLFLPLAQAIGRIGNYINQEAYGYVVSKSYLLALPITQKHIFVHPTFLYEQILLIFLFFYLKSIKSNYYLPTYLIAYGIIRILVESMRSDSQYIFSIKSAYLLSIFFIIIGGLLIKSKYYEKV